MAMDRRQDDDTLKKLYEFMGEMRASSEHRGDTLDKLERDIVEMKRAQVETIKKMEQNLIDTNLKVDGLVNKITKWESKLGAFLFIASCLWAFFITMKDQILTIFKG
jgi:hypothetical protein